MAPWHVLRPAAALLFGRYSSGAAYSTASGAGGASVACTRWLLREAWSGAPRECPTPLVLLRTPGITWRGAERATEEEWTMWADMFAQRGYTTVEVDVSASLPLVADVAASAAEPAGDADNAAGTDAGSAVWAAATALNSQLRMLNIPFAPVVIASGPACLVAQAYVSDHRASGLVLVSPPPDADPRPQNDRSGFSWPSFNYEPHFPILVVAPDAAAEQSIRESRVGRAEEDGTRRGGKGVTIMVSRDGPRGDGTRNDVERWMDMCGF